MRLICDNKECSYEWEYKGKMIWATCPSCRLKVSTKGELDPSQEGDASNKRREGKKRKSKYKEQENAS